MFFREISKHKTSLQSGKLMVHKVKIVPQADVSSSINTGQEL